MASKIKRTQKENLEETSGRDMFQTPNYATDLIVPFLDKRLIVWECAAGKGKITNRLKHHRFSVISSELQTPTEFIHLNFLTDKLPDAWHLNIKNFCIVTNPPYSLKKKFYEKCMEYKVPFALLIPADYSGWVIRALQNGAEKVIPDHRINFITPTGKSEETGHSANYHSLWLTYGLNIGKSETFVELTKEMRKNI